MSWSHGEVTDADQLVKGDRFFLTGRNSQLRHVDSIILDGTKVTINSTFVRDGRQAQVMNMAPTAAVVRYVVEES